MQAYAKSNEKLNTLEWFGDFTTRKYHNIGIGWNFTKKNISKYILLFIHRNQTYYVSNFPHGLNGIYDIVKICMRNSTKSSINTYVYVSFILFLVQYYAYGHESENESLLDFKTCELHTPRIFRKFFTSSSSQNL